MTNFKGTPGPFDNTPWKVCPEDMFVLDSENNMLLEVRDWGHLQRYRDEKALEIQSKRIQAASAIPEMIEALEELMILVEDNINGQYKFDSLSLQPTKVALTKAGVI